MKKKITISLAIIIVALLACQLTNKFAFTYDGAPPSGYANDPAGGNLNCVGCHGGAAATVTGWITSDIPGTGYVPGTTYNITATATGTGGNKGFEISTQSATGTFLGTLIAGTGTGLTGSNHYIRATGSSITTDPMVWTFTWTAPAAGSGTVGFYGAFAIGTGTTKITSYMVNEYHLGIAENNDNSGFSVFPNPASDNIIIENAKPAKDDAVNIYNMEGKLMLNQPLKQATSQIDISAFSKGIYFVNVRNDKGSTLQKVVKE